MYNLINVSSALDSIRNTCTDEYGDPNGYEFWYARDLMPLLGYKKWQDFENCIQRSINMCTMLGITKNQHFYDVTHSRNVDIPKGNGGYKIVKTSDYQLSRYACYLISINGNTPACAYAQAYFLTKAREMELMTQHYNQLRQLQIREECRITDKHFSSALNNHGISSQGIGRVKSKGDEALFGGINTKEMKEQLGVNNNITLYDVLDPRVAAGRRLASELTIGDINDKNLYGEEIITSDHIDNNGHVRGFLIDRGIIPENLPAIQNSNSTQRYITSEEKDLIDYSGMYTSPIIFIKQED